jgi:hypothetical protein
MLNSSSMALLKKNDKTSYVIYIYHILESLHTCMHI